MQTPSRTPFLRGPALSRLGFPAPGRLPLTGLFETGQPALDLTDAAYLLAKDLGQPLHVGFSLNVARPMDSGRLA